jgi:hypothetical protein
MEWWDKDVDVYDVTVTVPSHELASKVMAVVESALAAAGITNIGIGANDVQVSFGGRYLNMPRCVCGHDKIKHFAFLFGIFDEPIGAETTCALCDCEKFLDMASV